MQDDEISSSINEENSSTLGLPSITVIDEDRAVAIDVSSARNHVKELLKKDKIIADLEHQLSPWTMFILSFGWTL